MPELPEVETVARLIRPRLVGRVAEGLDLDWARTLVEPARGRCRRELAGRRFVAVERRAKWIRLRLEGERELLVHLRMTGRLLVRSAREEPSPWSRARVPLAGGELLEFVDPRKFGRLVWTADPEACFAGLGLEPLGELFDAAWLRAALRGRRSRLKPLLLDQSFLAGLGNIYVDESLHRARLHPARVAAKLSAAECELLCTSIRAVLEEAIEREGSSFDVFYRTPEGKPGSFQDSFRVYGREGRPCAACGTPIRRCVIAQRGTHFCPRCQPAPRARRSSGRAG